MMIQTQTALRKQSQLALEQENQNIQDFREKMDGELAELKEIHDA